MKYNKKKHDKLVIIGDPGPISVIIYLVNKIHNGWNGFTDEKGNGIYIPDSYDFVDMKRILGKETRRYLKEKDKMKGPLLRQEFLGKLGP